MSTFWQLRTRSAAQSLIPEAQTSGIFQSSKHRIYAGETSDICTSWQGCRARGSLSPSFSIRPILTVWTIDGKVPPLFRGKFQVVPQRYHDKIAAPFGAAMSCRMTCLTLSPASTLRRVRRSLPAPMSGAAKGSPPRTSARWYRARRCIACRDSPRLPRSRTTW